jgi:hypothetical protein
MMVAMKLPNAKRFGQALARRTSERTPDAGGRLEPTPLSPETLALLDEHGVPAALRDFLEQHSYNLAVTIGELVFDEVNALPGEHRHEPQLRCLRAGLLVVGSGANGDPIAVDLAHDLDVGYLAHEELWGDPTADARALFVATPFDLGTFFLAAALHTYDGERDWGFPADSYGAQEQNELGWDELEPDAGEPAS